MSAKTLISACLPFFFAAFFFVAANAQTDVQALDTPGIGQPRWGASPTEVKNTEMRPLTQSNDDTLVYDAPLLGVPCMLLYDFENGALVAADYFCTPDSPKNAQAFYLGIGGEIEKQYPGISDTQAGRMLVNVLLEYADDNTYVGVINKHKTDGTVIILQEEQAYHKKIQAEIASKTKR